MSPREREIKLATADLVDDLHGLEAAAALIGKGKSHVHRCGSVNDAESFLNLRDAAELERRASEPHVTRLLCKLAGGVFLKLPEPFGDAEGLPLHVMEIARELGDVSGRVSEAMADGEVTARECEAIEADLDQLIDRAVHMRAHVRAKQGKPAGALREIGDGSAVA